MKCPYCKKKLSPAQEIADWDKAYGNKASCPIMIALACVKCNHIPYVMYIEETDEEVVTDPLGKKVVFPKPKAYDKPPKINQFIPSVESKEQ